MNNIIVIAVALMLSTDGDITGTDPSKGACLCITERFNLRMSGELELQTKGDTVA